MEHVALYFFLLLFGGLILKFLHMFRSVFGSSDDDPKKTPYINSISGEGPADSAKRWLQYHKKAIIGHRILNDIKIPEDEKTDIDIGIDHAQKLLNVGGSCEISLSSTNSFNIHVANEILLVLTKLTNRKIHGTKSNMFFKRGSEYKSTIFIEE